MHKIYLIILFTISSFSSYAQQNFQPGYIITLTNEKIEGLINDLDWRVNPDAVQFRKNTESASTEYTALSINEFGVGNRRYWGRVVTLDQSAEKSDDLLLGVDAIKKEIDTVFVEVLVEGQITLLYSMSKNRKAHYLYEVNGKTEELIVKRTIINKLDAMGNNAGKEVATTDIYKGQLKSLMQDCSSISSTIEKTRLTTNDLQKLFIKYLSCIGDKYTVEENTNKSVVNWGIMAGAFFSSLKFEPEIYSGKFNASGIPVGISADVVLAKNPASAFRA